VTDHQTAATKATVQRWLAAVNANDLDALVACFEPDGSWQNVPNAPAVGHAAIRAMLAPIFERSERVVWDIVTEAYAPGRAWLERVDRFVIDGTEHAVRCNGVLEIGPDSGLITELRDYVDLAEWRSRTTSVLLS